MKRSKAIELGQPIMAKFCGATVAGVPPRIMGIGPSAAIPKLLGKFQLTKDDIDIFEINEAFASMAVYCLNVLGLDHAKMNPRGGAIALGHPLGATGARQICTILSEARRTKKKILVTSMCVSISPDGLDMLRPDSNFANRLVLDRVWLVSLLTSSCKFNAQNGGIFLDEHNLVQKHIAHMNTSPHTGRFLSPSIPFRLSPLAFYPGSRYPESQISGPFDTLLDGVCGPQNQLCEAYFVEATRQAY